MRTRADVASAWMLWVGIALPVLAVVLGRIGRPSSPRTLSAMYLGDGVWWLLSAVGSFLPWFGVALIASAFVVRALGPAPAPGPTRG